MRVNKYYSIVYDADLRLYSNTSSVSYLSTNHSRQPTLYQAILNHHFTRANAQSTRTNAQKNFAKRAFATLKRPFATPPISNTSPTPPKTKSPSPHNYSLLPFHQSSFPQFPHLPLVLPFHIPQQLTTNLFRTPHMRVNKCYSQVCAADCLSSMQ